MGHAYLSRYHPGARAVCDMVNKTLRPSGSINSPFRSPRLALFPETICFTLSYALSSLLRKRMEYLTSYLCIHGKAYIFYALRSFTRAYSCNAASHK